MAYKLITYESYRSNASALARALIELGDATTTEHVDTQEKQGKETLGENPDGQYARWFTADDPMPRRGPVPNGYHWKSVRFEKDVIKNHPFMFNIILTIGYQINLIEEHVHLIYLIPGVQCPDTIDAEAYTVYRRFIGALQKAHALPATSDPNQAPVQLRRPMQPTPVAAGYRFGPFSFIHDGTIRIERDATPGFELFITTDGDYLIHAPGSRHIRIQFEGLQWLILERRGF